jgi:hypothetical protein
MLRFAWAFPRGRKPELRCFGFEQHEVISSSKYWPVLQGRRQRQIFEGPAIKTPAVFVACMALFVSTGPDKQS